MDPTIASSLVGVAGAPVVVALVNALVKPLTDNERLYPVASVLLGILWNVALAYALVEAGATPKLLLVNTIITGLLTGLAAGGVYSAVSNEARRMDAPAAARKVAAHPKP